MAKISDDKKTESKLPKTEKVMPDGKAYKDRQSTEQDVDATDSNGEDATKFVFLADDPVGENLRCQVLFKI